MIHFIATLRSTICLLVVSLDDSCISQLLSITHEIFKGFYANPPLDTRVVFLDISKAFDRVWHEGLIFKLQSYGSTGSLLSLLKDFISEILQRVLLNGQVSMWENILAGVPQGSILSPLLFLIFINDLPINLESVVKIYADDTSLLSIVKDNVYDRVSLPHSKGADNQGRNIHECFHKATSSCNLYSLHNV